MRFQRRLIGIVWGVALICCASCLLGEDRAREKHDPPVKIGVNLHFKYEWGLVVDRVEPNSAAERIGLATGDVIVELNGISIRSLGHYYRLLGSARNRTQLTWEQAASGRVVQRSLLLQERAGNVEVIVPDSEIDNVSVRTHR